MYFRSCLSITTFLQLQPTSNQEAVFETMSFRDAKDKLKEDDNLPESRGPNVCSELSSSEEFPAAIDAITIRCRADSPSSCSFALSSDQKRVPDMTSQGVQTSSPTASSAIKTDINDQEENKDHVPE